MFENLIRFAMCLGETAIFWYRDYERHYQVQFGGEEESHHDQRIVKIMAKDQWEAWEKIDGVWVSQGIYRIYD